MSAILQVISPPLNGPTAVLRRSWWPIPRLRETAADATLAAVVHCPGTQGTYWDAYATRTSIAGSAALGPISLAAAAPMSDPGLDRAAGAALRQLTRESPTAQALNRTAVAVLVFPKIVKVGFVLGGAYGEGGLLQAGRTLGYYNSSAASYGLQAGVQWFGYALFIMNAGALKYLDDSKGFEIGVGPSVVVVDAGLAKKYGFDHADPGHLRIHFRTEGPDGRPRYPKVRRSPRSARRKDRQAHPAADCRRWRWPMRLLTISCAVDASSALAPAAYRDRARSAPATPSSCLGFYADAACAAGCCRLRGIGLLLGRTMAAALPAPRQQ